MSWKTSDVSEEKQPSARGDAVGNMEVAAGAGTGLATGSANTDDAPKRNIAAAAMIALENMMKGKGDGRGLED